MQFELNYDILGIIAEMIPSSLICVNKRLNKLAYDAITGCNVYPEMFTRARFERFTKCSNDAQFGKLVLKFIPRVISMGDAANYLYKHGLYTKLEILATYHAKLHGENKYMMLLNKSQIIDYFQHHELDAVLIINNKFGDTLLRLTKWASFIMPEDLLCALSLEQIKSLYNAYPEIANIDNIYARKVLYSLPIEKLNIVIAMRKICPVAILLQAIKKNATLVLETIASSRAQITFEQIDNTNMVSEAAYVLMCVNIHGVDDHIMGALKNQLQSLQPSAGFADIVAAFTLYIECWNNRDDMPEIVRYRRNNLIRAAGLAHSKALFEPLFAWCCKERDTKLALKMAKMGTVQKISIEHHPYKDQALYNKMIIKLLGIKNRSHMETVYLVLSHLEECGMNDELKLALMAFVDASKSCTCPASELINQAIALASTNPAPKDYGDILTQSTTSETIFDLMVVQAYLQSNPIDADD